MRQPRTTPSKTAWWALAVWALAAACAAFWASRVLVRPAGLPPGTTTVPSVQALRGDVTRLLGEPADEEETPDAPVAAESSRFRLLGVAAPRMPQAAAEGVALIAVDGKPARAYRVGAVVEGALVVQRVHARGADLGGRDAEQASVSLTVAPLPPPATGVPTASTRPPGAPAFVPPGSRPAPRPMAVPNRVQAAEAAGDSESDGGGEADGGDDHDSKPATPGGRGLNAVQ